MVKMEDNPEVVLDKNWKFQTLAIG